MWVSSKTFHSLQSSVTLRLCMKSSNSVNAREGKEDIVYIRHTRKLSNEQLMKETHDKKYIDF